MKWFDLVMAIFYAFCISINIVGMVASYNAIRRYQEALDILHKCKDILSIMEKYRK